MAVDLHPDLPSTRLGQRLAATWGVPVIPVAHHAAHAAAALAEHGLARALALVFDGVGQGDDPDDDAMWGGELLALDLAAPPRARPAVRRLGTFAAAPLPGGDVAALEPGRQLAGRLAVLDAGAPLAPEHPAWGWCGPAPAVSMWRRQCERGVNAPRSRAVGRLFDTASAALGLAPVRITYEGQAAIRLESAAQRWATRGLALPADVAEAGMVVEVAVAVAVAGADASSGPRWVVRWEPWLRAAITARALAEARGTWDDAHREAWAYGFHAALARAASALAVGAATSEGQAPPVVLTGGVFQNRLLCQLVGRALAAQGVEVREHRLIPPNDGGVALGQAVLAGRERACV